MAYVRAKKRSSNQMEDTGMIFHYKGLDLQLQKFFHKGALLIICGGRDIFSGRGRNIRINQGSLCGESRIEPVTSPEAKKERLDSGLRWNDGGCLFAETSKAIKL